MLSVDINKRPMRTDVWRLVDQRQEQVSKADGWHLLTDTESDTPPKQFDCGNVP